MLRCDLHVHTTASDGVFPPEDVVFMARRAGLQVMAITDHDTIAGLPAARRAAEAAPGLRLIEGTEISAGADRDIHILGYGASLDHPSVRAFFAQMQEERRERAHQMLSQLKENGYFLNEDALFAEAKGSIGRPHVARALVDKGYVQSVPEAFERLIGKGCVGYVPPRRELSPAHVIRMFRDAGCVPVAAHPAMLPWTGSALLPMLRAWKDAGLMGLEVYHPCQRGDFDRWRRLADSMDLIPTGGSDFHALNTQDGPLGGTADDWVTAEDDAGRLLSALHSH